MSVLECGYGNARSDPFHGIGSCISVWRLTAADPSTGVTGCRTTSSYAWSIRRRSHVKDLRGFPDSTVCTCNQRRKIPHSPWPLIQYARENTVLTLLFIICIPIRIPAKYDIVLQMMRSKTEEFDNGFMSTAQNRWVRSKSFAVCESFRTYNVRGSFTADYTWPRLRISLMEIRFIESYFPLNRGIDLTATIVGYARNFYEEHKG